MKDIGFDIVYKNRSKLSRFKSGGLIIAIRYDISFKWRQIKNNYDTLFSIKIYDKTVNLQIDLIIANVYISPSHSRYGNEDNFKE